MQAEGLCAEFELCVGRWGLTMPCSEEVRKHNMYKEICQRQDHPAAGLLQTVNTRVVLFVVVHVGLVDRSMLFALHPAIPSHPVSR